MRLRRGQYVHHSKHGWGTILEDDGNHILVYFHTVGVKRFATSSDNFDMVGGEVVKKKAFA